MARQFVDRSGCVQVSLLFCFSHCATIYYGYEMVIARSSLHSILVNCRNRMHGQTRTLLPHPLGRLRVDFRRRHCEAAFLGRRRGRIACSHDERRRDVVVGLCCASAWACFRVAQHSGRCDFGQSGANIKNNSLQTRGLGSPFYNTDVSTWQLLGPLHQSQLDCVVCGERKQTPDPSRNPPLPSAICWGGEPPSPPHPQGSHAPLAPSRE